MSSGVEFDEDKTGSLNRAYNVAQNESKMTKWLIAHGMASSSSSAQIVLVVFVVINFVIAYIVIKYFA